jgi:hypothetical protein
MSELDAALLARHTRLLLRCYPKAYRTHRGEEIFDTLLETTRPGLGWPPAREVASVIGGGLRARRAANLSQGLGASLRHVGLLTGAMILAGMPAALLSIIGNPSRYHLLRDAEPGLVLASLLVVTALAAAWCGRRWLAVAAAVAATAFEVVAWQQVTPNGWNAIIGVAPAPLVGVALLSLTRRSERPPASLLWLPCLPPAVAFVESFAASSGLFIHDWLPGVLAGRTELLLDPYYTYLSLVPVLVAVCWLVTDVRPLAALALEFLLGRILYPATLGHGAGTWTQMVIAAGLSLAITCALIWLLRHRARTAPPTIG